MSIPIGGAPPSEGDGNAAKQLEAYFLRRVLAEVKTGSAGMGAGFAGETFQQMFNDAIADAMAEAGGLGISDVIMNQLEGDAERLAARAPSSRIPGLAGSESGANTLGLPVDGRKSSSFGSRIHPISGVRKFHAGVDIAAKTGTPAHAAEAGVVTRAERAGGYGNLVVVKHAGGRETRYAHLSAIDVHVGEQVSKGQPIGKVGATGSATGPHLHFEVRQDGKAVDPEKAWAEGDSKGSESLTSHKMREKDGVGLNRPPVRPNRSSGGY